MADNRSKRQSSVAQWNIPPSADQLPDPKSSKASAIDALFDSGYDSQTVSKSSIDLEADFDQKVSISDSNFSQKDFSAKPSKQWTDSGLGITTDSGVNIDDDYNEDTEKQNYTKNSLQTTANLLREAFATDQDGDTYLHMAIIKGIKDLSYALIRIVPHPDFLDVSNHLFQTPLHLAALTRQPAIVRRLMISGATVDLRDRHGNTALHIACAQSDFDTVYQIIAPITPKEMTAAQVVNYPINAKHLPTDFLELRNYEGETCLHLAAYNKSKKIIDTLIKSGANVNAQEGKSGKSVLHWSVENQSLDFVEFLVNHCKADVNVRSYAGHTPLHLAWLLSAIHPTSNKLKAIIKFLRESKAEPSERPTIYSDSESDSEDD